MVDKLNGFCYDIGVASEGKNKMWSVKKMDLVVNTKNGFDLALDEFFAMGEDLDKQLAEENESEAIEAFSDEAFNTIKNQSLQPKKNVQVDKNAVSNYAYKVIRERLEKSYDIVTFLKTEGTLTFWEVEKNGDVQVVNRDGKLKVKMHNLGNCWEVRYGNEYVRIWKIQDGGFLAKSHCQYRIDNKHGQTVETMINHFQTAKSVAVKLLKEVEK